MINLNSTAVVQTFEPQTNNNVAVSVKSVTSTDNHPQGLAKKDLSLVKEPNKTDENASNNKKGEEVSQAMLDGLSNDIASLHSVELSFSKNKETGHTVIKVINKDTNQVIREIPQQQVFNIASKLDEMVGMFFYTKA
jgi:flagellar protein FlaG